MDVMEAIKVRRSVRAYGPEEVPEEVMRRVFEAGRLAPSAFNYQPWHYIVVMDERMRDELSKAAKFGKFLREAPVVLVACGDTKRSPGWNQVDVTISLQQMVLMATAEGLGTCWIGKLDKERVRELLDIPESWDVVAMLTMGYPREKVDLVAKVARSGKRKEIGEIFSRERFGNELSL